ncbi:PWWP domain [Dillenia turbinata]|uniref:PWWP domain n=1 Tax=Dillenia turbinata TaxID=194707 RepID=A0AAN8Z5X8_9MAGN
MGSSGSSKGTGGGGGGVDNTVGSIVWVRRRNGSWWPGKILGPDELSASHLMSPRSGTPVKLLGREDANWYNLEKSRRVKAFRCGEFDDCIERAESSQGMPIKKREKYARREDAIIHALELEKKLLRKRQEELGVSPDCTSGKLSDAVDKELVASPENSGCSSGKHGSLEEPIQHSEDMFSSPEHESKVKSRYISKTKEEKLQNWEDDNSEVIPRMRGLQDLGLRTAPSKRKASPLAASNGARKLAVDNNAYAFASGGIGLRSTTDANNKSLLDKRKRLNEGLTEESLVKRRDKHRPLVQVLESSAKLPVLPSIKPSNGAVTDGTPGGDHGKSRMVFSQAGSSDCFDKGIRASQTDLLRSQFEDSACRPSQDSFSEDTSSGSTESTESDLSETHYLEPDVDEKINEYSDAAAPSDELKAYGRSQVQGECGSFGNDGPDESALSGYVSQGHLDDPGSSSVGVSKWQLKGKRNIRLMKRPSDAIDGKGSNGSGRGLHFQEKLSSFRQRTLGRSLGFYGNNDELDNSHDDDTDLIENDFRAQMVGFHNDRYLKSRDSSRGRNTRSHITDWESLAWDDQPAFKGYWEGHRESLDAVSVGDHHPGARMKSMLFDVDLKVHASYQGEHVPIVSLMSRLNGQAVIGHPISVEVLEDGSTTSFLPRNDDFGDIPDQDGHTPFAPVWRTARRTSNFRIPRPHLSTLDGDETIEHHQYLGQDRKPQFKKLTSRSVIQKGRLPKKGLHVSRPLTDRKANRKPPKKVSLSSNQKTRTLSSIAVDHKLGYKSNIGGQSYYMDGLIKSEESGPTTVACIPVKLVFSRLHEAVGRPPSRPIHTDLDWPSSKF